MRWAAMCVLAALLAAGCAQPVPDEETSPPQVSYGFACSGASSPMACAGTLASGRLYYTEPYVAAHPEDGDVWAIGAMAADNPAYAAEDTDNVGAARSRIMYWFTEDGGTSWRESLLPAIVDELAVPTSTQWSMGDPVTHIDAQGVTHVFGIYETFDPFYRAATWSVFYLSSNDLGRTWGTPQTLSDGGFNDRPWFIEHDGAFYLSWWVAETNEFPEGQEEGQWRMARSTDGGASWSVVGGTECWVTGPWSVVHGVPMFGCRDGDVDEVGSVALLAYDGVTMVEVAREQQNCAMPLVHEAAVGVVLSMALCEGGGPTVASAPSVEAPFDVTPVDDLLGRRVSELLWRLQDPHGMLHWIVLTNPEGRDASSTGGNADFGHLDYVVLNPITFEVLLDVRIRDEPDDPDTSIPTTTGLGGSRFVVGLNGDHFHGIAWGQERGLAVWTGHNGVLHMAWVQAS